MRSRLGVSVTVQPSSDRCMVAATSWPPAGSRRELASGGGQGGLSDVEEADVLRVAGDEAAAGVDVLAHQDAEQLVGGRGVLEGYLQQDPGLRVHRGLPQLGRVHLAEALEPLDGVVLDLAALLGTEAERALLLLVGVDVLVT